MGKRVLPTSTKGRDNVIRLGSASEEAEILSVVIEVKGCWHKELLTAMKTQLAGRYMKDNNLPSGLYLVGWYKCDKWDNTDYRKSAVPKNTIEELEKILDNEANRLKNSHSFIKQIKPIVLDLSL